MMIAGMLIARHLKGMKPLGGRDYYSPITIVAAITSKFEESLYPTEVLIKASEGGLESDSVVLLNQIRSIDKQRLIKRLGALKSGTMEKVDQVIQISLGLVKI